MNEQEFEKEIRDIKGELQSIRRNTKQPIWRSFFTGTLSGLGSVFGAAIALAAIGWILNTIGVIPAFHREVTRINAVLDEFQKSR